MLFVNQNFLGRRKRTPLCVTVAYWDGTEAQTKQALHGHVPMWAKRRKISATEFRPRPAMTEQHVAGMAEQEMTLP